MLQVNVGIFPFIFLFFFFRRVKGRALGAYILSSFPRPFSQFPQRQLEQSLDDPFVYECVCVCICLLI